MLTAMTFDPRWSGWSAFTFWTVAISIALTLGFTVVIFIGGLGDLRFLLRSLDESPDDAPHSEDERKSNP